jgi:hypothetical protein
MVLIIPSASSLLFEPSAPSQLFNSSTLLIPPEQIRRNQQPRQADKVEREL